jgi:hypothetical protein
VIMAITALKRGRRCCVQSAASRASRRTCRATNQALPADLAKASLVACLAESTFVLSRGDGVTGRGLGYAKHQSVAGVRGAW